MSAHVPIEGHPGFYRRGGLVYFRFRDRRRRLRWDSAQTIKEAERKKVKRELEVERGDFQDGSRERFADYARSWIDTYVGRTARGISETTRDDYRRRLEEDAVPYFGKMRLGEIEPRDVKEYARKLEKPDPGAARAEHGPACVAPVRALFATAVEEGVLRSNPAAGLRLASAPELRRRGRGAGEGDERGRARAAAGCGPPKGDGWRLFFDVLAWSGLRIGEADRAALARRRPRPADRPRPPPLLRRPVGPPKSKYGKRRLRLTPRARPRALAAPRRDEGGRRGPRLHRGRRHPGFDPSNLMRRVLKPAAVEAGLGEWVREGGQAAGLDLGRLPQLPPHLRDACSSGRAGTPSRCSAGSATTSPRSPSTPTSTCSMRTCPSRRSSTGSAACDTDVTQAARNERDAGEAAESKNA